MIPTVDMWITLRFAPSYPHIHSYYFVAPANWGHLYFGKQGTFLLWVDSLIAYSYSVFGLSST
jgi:hypothetical protein